MKLTKDQTVTVSWSTLVSVVGSLVAVWTFAAPIAGQAIKGQVQDQIRQEIKPLHDAQIITITATVRNLEKAIVAMEFKRDMCANAPNCWTIRDAEDLTAARTDLVAAQAALRALRQ